MSLSVATTSSVFATTSSASARGMIDDAVAVAEQVVAGRDRDAADRDRLAVAIRNPALDDVGRRQERAEHRKALLEHEVGVARAAVDDVAQHAARLRASARTARPSARPRDCCGWQTTTWPAGAFGEQRAPAEQRLVARLRAVDVAGDRPHRTGEPRAGRDRLDRRAAARCCRAPSSAARRARRRCSSAARRSVRVMRHRRQVIVMAFLQCADDGAHDRHADDHVAGVDEPQR